MPLFPVAIFAMDLKITRLATEEHLEMNSEQRSVN